VASETLVHNMMEEFVDCTVIEIAKLIFEYMQSRSARLVEGFNPGKGKGPILLRTTNELKRRLSRETDAAFIGRIMIFISLLLPPWERSGVNLRGNYNVESITKYEEPEQDENKMAIDIDDDSTGIWVSLIYLTLDSFYVKFWSLQKYLKNPIVLHDQNVLDEFKPKLDFVINKFFSIEQERLKLRGQAVSNKTTPDQKMDIVIGSEDKSEYYPGFLKSRQLFDLQVPSF
jgi:THO complex subunit 1